MPNTLTALGLTLNTQEELVTLYATAFRSIYGSDINLESDTPDGQWMMILIEAVLDLQDLLRQIYNSFDPDLAFGNVLDQRVAINGIQRQGGTHTVTRVTVTTSQSVNLYGVDQNVNDPYRVSDNEGNEFVLQVTVSLPSAGDFSLQFQAVNPGAILTVPNTITTPVTIVLGVVSVNNPTSYTTVGINEETDADLKIRRQRSVALSSQGYLQGLLAALLNIPGMISAFVYENNSGTIDGDGIPGHSIWVIVSGSAPSQDIANAIYTKRNAGCGMKGDQTFVITQVDGSLFTIRWDIVTPEPLFIKFDAISLDGVNPPNIELIRQQLPILFRPGVYQQVNINQLSTIIQQIDPNTLVENAGFSTSLGGSYTPTLLPTTKDKQFAVSEGNTVILPIILNPTAPEVAVTEEIQFSALGGYGSYVYSIETNNSGASIDSSTGLYTAGAVDSVTDVVRATDADGNFTDVNVDVIA